MLADGDVAVVLQDPEALRRYAEEHGLTLGDSMVGVVDLDAVIEWLDSHQRPDATLLLAAWNLLLGRGDRDGTLLPPQIPSTMASTTSCSGRTTFQR